jgi:hypothetical protein
MLVMKDDQVGLCHKISDANILSSETIYYLQWQDSYNQGTWICHQLTCYTEILFIGYHILLSVLRFVLTRYYLLMHWHIYKNGSHMTFNLQSLIYI